MEQRMQLKEPVVVGTTTTGKPILFTPGGFPGSKEAGNGNSLFEVK